MMNRRPRDSQPASPSGSDEDDDANRSPISGDEDGKKSPTFGNVGDRGRKISRKGLTVLNDELKRDVLDIVH